MFDVKHYVICMNCSEHSISYEIDKIDNYFIKNNTPLLETMNLGHCSTNKKRRNLNLNHTQKRIEAKLVRKKLEMSPSFYVSLISSYASSFSFSSCLSFRSKQHFRHAAFHQEITNL